MSDEIRAIQSSERRHDIDWLRVIAIGLLIIYHIVLAFQPWGQQIEFIQSPGLLEWLWIPMSAVNVWRIPLLFYVSGMGVYFSMRRRDWKEFSLERTKRIVLPLVFGSLAIVPIHRALFQRFYGLEVDVLLQPNPGHLWFLFNLVLYVLWFVGVFLWMKDHPDSGFMRGFRWLVGRPWGIYLLAIPFMLEAQLVSPEYYSSYITGHGLLLGAMAFFLGFCFVQAGDSFWLTANRMKFVSLGLALVLFSARLLFFELESPPILMGLESVCWLLAIFGLGHAYLRRPSKALAYLSQASYPVYIIHMAFQFAASAWVFQQGWSAAWSLIVMVGLTFAGCMVTYEILRRTGPLRVLFGMRWNRARVQLRVEKAVD